MSFGFQVTINGVDVALDDSYKNMVRKGGEDKSVSAGYNTIDFSSYADENLIAAIRHKGMGVTFLGYIYENSKRTGIRLYCSSAGTVELAYYVAFWPIMDTSVGVTIYDANGSQTFHSDHYYLDVLKTGKLESGPIEAGDGFYILSNPESPTMSYHPWSMSQTTENKTFKYVETCSYQNVQTCSWVQRCSGVYPNTVCSPAYVCTSSLQYVCTGSWQWVTTGYTTISWGGVECTKTIGMVNQDANGKLTKNSVTLNNSQSAYSWTSYSTWPGTTDYTIKGYTYVDAPNTGITTAPTVVINDT